jgi:hypothetical protein
LRIPDLEKAQFVTVTGITVITMDFFVVAKLINRSFDMAASLLGNC